MGIPLQITHELRSPDYGPSATGKQWTEVLATAHRSDDLNQPLLPGAEPWSAHVARGGAALTAIAHAHPTGRVLVVAHAETIKATMSRDVGRVRPDPSNRHHHSSRNRNSTSSFSMTTHRRRPYRQQVAVDRTWRSPDRAYLIDQVVDEPGVQYRLWDAEGAPVAEAASPSELDRLLTSLGVNISRLEEVPVDDPWCE